jgi:tRNA modification GTPase
MSTAHPPVAAPIAAIATAAGRGGIGVVRISGGKGGALLQVVMHAVLGKSLEARHATYMPFKAADDIVIDQGIALWFPAPHSYTGEDVLELQGHGGPIVLKILLARCLEAGRSVGLRLARPGEFTQRAFLNGKLDLAQAEAVADLIEASTEAAARSASASMTGAFSREVHALVEQVINLRMLVEATLDFPEEEIEFLEKSDARGQLARIRTQLERVIDQSRQGAMLRAGLKVVLIGQPNVGKSSLLNALAGREAAIVTPIAGTTRDKVTETIEIEGIPLAIIDTAGLRDTQDVVEKIGIERTWAEIAAADVILHLQDATQSQQPMDAHIASRLPPKVPVRTVFNKIDLAGLSANVQGEAIYLCAKSGTGVDLLRAELLKIAGWHSTGESVFLARERHLQALSAAREHLNVAAQHAAQNDRVLDLFAEELRLAQEALGAITGEFTPDDLLGVIFSRFCIGK